MTQITYPSDVTGSLQIAQGSDGRLNVSGRVDSRSYYNSRDRGQTYSLVFDDADAAVADYFCYLQNTSTDKELVLDAIGINSTVACSIKLAFVTGTAAGSSSLTPVNLNKQSSNAAAATARGDGAVTGLTEDGVIDLAMVTAGGHEEFRLKERVRLGQNDAIALEYDRAAGNGIVEGVIFFYYE